MSTAVATNRVSAVVGYSLEEGNFDSSSPNMPMSIVIFGEANTANQSGLSTTPQEVTSAQQADTLYGAGSPISAMTRILKPRQGGGSNVPVIVFPQVEDEDATARIQTITVTGPATASGTHYVKVAGRTNVDGSFYGVTIASGDSASTVAGKIRDAINNVLGSPVSATALSAVVTVTTKWKGLSAQGVNLEMDTTDQGSALGLTYVVAETQAGVFTPDIAASLALIGNEWRPILVNGYGTVTAILTALEGFNGVPSATNPTGRYVGTTFKPLVALTGSVADDPSSVTSGRKNNCTIVICPAPLSPGMHYEAAANAAVLLGNQAQDNPHSDIIYQTYPDMPMPDSDSVPLMQSYNERDRIAKLGCSTVMIDNGVYKIMDFFTTWRPDGEVPPQYRRVSALVKHWNVRFSYFLMQRINVLGKTLVNDNDTVTVDNIIKPKMLKGLLADMFEDLTARAIIVDPAFSIKSVKVTIGGNSNPDRIDDEWAYKISGIAAIAATVVKGGVNTGVVS